MSNLPFHDRTDFDDAERGLIASLEPAVVTAADGRVVWDNDAYAFLDAACPSTAHPSLWRQSQLCAKQGLYEVTPGVYQIRGLDLSNMTVVEGDRGVIVIDPLISMETAAAALALYRRHRGDRPVTAVIYTHAHVDHFGGVRGVVAEASDVPIVAPEGFMESAVAENVYAGPAMARRALYMYGSLLEKSPAGQIGCGLGQTTSSGSIGLLAPTIDITHTGQELVLDGVPIRFQLTPGTECPAEMNFLFPRHRALCLAENATHNLHNLVTLRGALVRDARVWSRYLGEALDLFADDLDVSFASHHWPTWGRDRVVEYVSEQRDLYAYLHDQTLRLANQGLTGVEIAEELELPPALQRAWHTHGYYGSVSHNVKAIYQRYLGWFDGNPAHLWEHPPVAKATRYVDCMGGADAVLDLARSYLERDDLRFAAELLNHVVFADESNTAARELLASTYDRLGQGAENATWRNFFLSGALELREGLRRPPSAARSLDMLLALSVDQLFDAIAVRVNGPRAWDEHVAIDWEVTDVDRTYRTTLRNGVLVTEADPRPGVVDLTVTLSRTQLLGVLAGGGLDGIDAAGDADVLARLLGVVDHPGGTFPIITRS